MLIFVSDTASECGTPYLEDQMGEQTDDDGPDDVGPPNVVGVADAICSSSSSLSGIPAPVEWPESWTAFVATVRNAKGPLFLECFAGTEVMTNEMRSAGWETAPPIDVVTNPDINLLHPTFVMIVVGLIK